MEQQARDVAAESFEADADGTRRVVVGTDGSGLNPRHPLLRRCGYSLFFGPGHSQNVGLPLLGAFQTVLRAELRAVVRVAQRMERPTKVVSDCLWVVKGCEKVLAGESASDLDHADLWEALRRAVVTRPGLLLVVKVQAHQKKVGAMANGTNMLHWCLNDGADGLAKDGARAHHIPPEVKHGAQRRARIAAIIQSMHLAVLRARAPHLQAHYREHPFVKPKEWE